MSIRNILYVLAYTDDERYIWGNNHGINTLDTPSTSLRQQTQPSIPLEIKLKRQDSQIAKHLQGHVIISLTLVWQITQSNFELRS